MRGRLHSDKDGPQKDGTKYISPLGQGWTTEGRNKLSSHPKKSTILEELLGLKELGNRLYHTALMSNALTLLATKSLCVRACMSQLFNSSERYQMSARCVCDVHSLSYPSRHFSACRLRQSVMFIASQVTLYSPTFTPPPEVHFQPFVCLSFISARACTLS